MRGWAVSINGASPVRANGTHLLLQISSIATRTGGREAITASARSRLASALSFMCSKKMIPVRGGLSRASIRVGREFVRLGRRTIFRHMARKRRKRASEAFPRAAKANRQLFFASKTDVARKRKGLTVTEV